MLQYDKIGVDLYYILICKVAEKPCWNNVSVSLDHFSESDLVFY